MWQSLPCKRNYKSSSEQVFELGDLSSGDDDDDIHDPQLPINLSDVAN